MIRYKGYEFVLNKDCGMITLAVVKDGRVKETTQFYDDTTTNFEKAVEEAMVKVDRLERKARA